MEEIYKMNKVLEQIEKIANVGWYKLSLPKGIKK